MIIMLLMLLLHFGLLMCTNGSGYCRKIRQRHWIYAMSQRSWHREYIDIKSGYGEKR